MKPLRARGTSRSRPVYAFLIGITVVLGLGSRHLPVPLRGWAAKELGDALYAVMVFFCVGFLAPATSTCRAALAATGLCFAVEISQLCQAPWIVAVRATAIGALVLGKGFHALDLVAYTLGALIAAGTERASRSSLRTPPVLLG